MSGPEQMRHFEELRELAKSFRANGLWGGSDRLTTNSPFLTVSHRFSSLAVLPIDKPGIWD